MPKNSSPSVLDELVNNPTSSHKEALQDVMKRQAELSAMWFLLLGPGHQLSEILNKREP